MTVLSPSSRPGDGIAQTSSGTRARIALIAAMVIVVVLQLLFMDATVGAYDEGVMLLGADRALNGHVPHRDFWTLYGPGGFHLLAALFRLFGESAFAARVLDAAFKAAIVAACYLLVRRRASSRISLAAGAAAFAIVVGIRNYGIPVFPAVAMALWALLALDAATRRGAANRLHVVAGALVGTALLFRHDLAAFALVAAAVSLWPGRIVAAGRWRPALAFAAGVIGVVALPALALLLVVPIGDLYRDYVEVPLRIYPDVRSLPFPDPVVALTEAAHGRGLRSLEALSVYLPIAVGVLALCVELDIRRRDGHGAAPAQMEPGNAHVAGAALHDRRLVLALTVLTLLFFQKGVVRVSLLHMSAALIVAVPLFALTLRRVPSLALRRTLVAIGGVACVLLLVRLVLSVAREGTDPGMQWPGARAPWYRHAATLCRDNTVPRLRCLRLDAPRGAVARWLLAHGSRGQRVYFGAGRHDKLFTADTALAFAAETVPPTRWYDLHPGVQTQRTIQAEMIRELESAPLRFVVINRQGDDKAEPNASTRSSGVTLLDEYLARRWRPAFSAGPLAVLVPAASGDAP